MSFKDDFIKTAFEDRDLAVRVYDKLTEDQRYSVGLFAQLATDMQTATTIRLRGEQAQVFLDTPSLGGQDYVSWLRLPFSAVYVQLDAPIQFGGYLSELDDATSADEAAMRSQEPIKIDIDIGGETTRTRVGDVTKIDRSEMKPDPDVRGIYITQSESPERLAKMHGAVVQHAAVVAAHQKDGSVPFSFRDDDHWAVPDNLARVIQAHFLMPTRSYMMNIHTAAVFITKDNQLEFSKVGFWQTRRRMLDWTIHFVNFLSSPSIKLVAQEHDAALQKARRSRGLPPKPGWYEITYRKHIHDYSPDKISTKVPAWKHGYRYDVRGHFKRFERGRMSGRVIWCPPHQRGVANELYRPKGYRVERDA